MRELYQLQKRRSAISITATPIFIFCINLNPTAFHMRAISSIHTLLHHTLLHHTLLHHIYPLHHTLLHHTLLHIYPLQHPMHISTPGIRAHPMPHTRPSMHPQLHIPTFILHLPPRVNTVSCCSVPIHDNSFAPSGPNLFPTKRAHSTH